MGQNWLVVVARPLRRICRHLGKSLCSLKTLVARWTMAVVTPELSLRGEQVRVRSTAPSDRPALVAIRDTPEVRRRWRGEDLAVGLDGGLAGDEVSNIALVLLGQRAM